MSLHTWDPLDCPSNSRKSLPCEGLGFPTEQFPKGQNCPYFRTTRLPPPLWSSGYPRTGNRKYDLRWVAEEPPKETGSRRWELVTLYHGVFDPCFAYQSNLVIRPRTMVRGSGREPLFPGRCLTLDDPLIVLPVVEGGGGPL